MPKPKRKKSTKQIVTRYYYKKVGDFWWGVAFSGPNTRFVEADITGEEREAVVAKGRERVNKSFSI